MKKIISLLLCLFITLGCLSSCRKNGTANNSSEAYTSSDGKDETNFFEDTFSSIKDFFGGNSSNSSSKDDEKTETNSSNVISNDEYLEKGNSNSSKPTSSDPTSSDPTSSEPTSSFSTVDGYTNISPNFVPKDPNNQFMSFSKIPDKYYGEFTYSGIWRYSSAFQSPMFAYPETMWTSGDITATATYNPKITSYGNVRISVHIPSNEANLDKNIYYEVRHNGKITRVYLKNENYLDKPSWFTLGTFDFCGNLNEYVVLKRIGKDGNVRASTICFEILNTAGDGTVWQNVFLGPAKNGNDSVEDKTMETYMDLSNHKYSYEAYYILQLGAIKVDGNNFNPDKTVTANDFCSWLNALTGQKHKKSGTTLTVGNVADLLYNSIFASNKNLEWVESKSKDSYTFLKDIGVISNSSPFNSKSHILTRAEACVLLKNFYVKFLSNGVDASKWQLSFHDEFSGGYDSSLWKCESGVPGHILSSRWQKNGEVKDGKLRLLTIKEKVAAAPDRDWTTGSVYTDPKKFKQKYGYWEASIKINAAAGLNNAFWMIATDHSFEIDIVEGHYPNSVNTNLHASGAQYSEKYISDYNLSADFHTYGLEWNENELIFYFDGKEIRRVKNLGAHSAVVPRFSTAVLNWAGRITDEADGCAMEVDWIRVYKQK